MTTTDDRPDATKIAPRLTLPDEPGPVEDACMRRYVLRRRARDWLLAAQASLTRLLEEVERELRNHDHVPSQTDNASSGGGRTEPSSETGAIK